MDPITELPDYSDKTKIGKETKKFRPFSSLMVGGLCKSLKNANEYRLSVLEKIRKEVGLSALQDKEG